MLTIITKDGIFTNPMRIFVHYYDDDSATICIWPNCQIDIHLSYYPVTPPMTSYKANNLYHRIADQVAAGVKVIDLRKMINEEGQAK